ncbi:MAG: hypothetical protein SFV23_19275 [Planctomycetaceae bacterium]|nr:hypothetical protein [Planctomycetaceae bacterium]
MEPAEILSVLQQVADVAALAGIRGRVNEERQHFEAGFNLAEGRSQMVYIRVAGKTPDGSTVITFFSPCHVVQKGFLSGITRNQALDLLKRNEQVMFARYGVWSMENSDTIVASCDRLIATLDHKDFYSTVWYVAMAADRFEKEQGSDKF